MKIRFPSFQYDPEGRKKRHLYYHYVNEFMPDKLIAKIRKPDAHAISFKVSYDYKYLILHCKNSVSIANIKSLAGEIRFDLIFKMSPDVNYVSKTYVQSMIAQLIISM